MTDRSEELVTLLSSGLSRRRLYFSSHPRVIEAGQTFTRSLESVLDGSGRDEFFLGVVEGHLVHEGRYLVGPTIVGGRLVQSVENLRSGGLLFRRGIEPHEICELLGLAAELTEQLLTFGRRQVFRPRVVLLNGVVEQSTGMLRRLVRENVEIEMELEPDVACVRVDPGQIQQMLLNLVRLRYRDTTAFLAVSSISSQYQFNANAGAGMSYVRPSGNKSYSGSLGLSYSEKPTISFAPLRGEDFVLAVPEDKAQAYRPHLGGEVVFGIRPEDTLDPEYAPPGIHAATIEAKVDVTELMGNEIIVYLVTEHIPPILGRFDPRTSARVGNTMQVAFNMDRMHVFDKQTEMAIR